MGEQPSFSLPPELVKIAPKYNNWNVCFASDLDKATYAFLAKKGKHVPENIAKLKSALEDAEISNHQAICHGIRVRAALRKTRPSGDGVINLPAQEWVWMDERSAIYEDASKLAEDDQGQRNTTENAIKKHLPWGLIFSILFLGTMIGSCNGYLRFLSYQEQIRFLRDEKTRVAQEKREREKLATAEKLEDERNKNLMTTLPKVVKERLEKFNDCSRSRPGVQGEALSNRVAFQFWLHYCLSGQPPNFKLMD